MSKLNAWLVTLAGVLLVLLPLGIFTLDSALFQWLLALVVLIIGITKLIKSYTG